MQNEKSKIYDALSVRKFTISGEETSEFLKVGVAFPLKTKNGFSLKLSSLPVSGELLVVERVPKKEQKSETEKGPF